MKKYICKYCSKELASKSSLNNHIKNAQYCIEKRENKEDVRIFECKYCSKTYTSNQSLQLHLSKCYYKKQQEYEKQINCSSIQYEERIKFLMEEINKRDNTIQQLQDKLENIAIKAVQRPTTTNMNKTQINNYIQKMDTLSLEHMLEQSSNLTLEHIQKGASGYAEYALEYPLKERIACVDYSRRKMKFKDKEGNLITDPEMVKLAPMFFNSIKEKSSEIVYSQNDPNMDSVMFETVAKLFNTNADVKNGADGVKSDFYHDFVKQVCSGSVVE